MLPFHGDPRDPRVTGQVIHNYMQQYAKEYNVLRSIRFNPLVSGTEQIPHGWRLSLRDSDDIIETQKLLVATRVISIPHMPKFEGDHDPSIPIINSRDVGTSYESLEDESVQQFVVVGAAKSAYDVTYLLLSLEEKVT